MAKEKNIRLVDLRAQYEKIKPEIDAAIANVLASTQFILGKEVGEFETAAAAYLQVKHAIGCGSGTDALQISLMAIGIQRGDEVITSPFSFVATAESIAILGGVPVFVDIDPLSYNIDPSKIEAAITPKTKAIIPVHLYGQSAGMDPVMELAKKHGLTVVEDSAQAFGAEYKGRKTGSLGDIACISFFPSKNIGAYGDGGLITTDDEELADRIRMIAQHGARKKYYHEILGVNSRLDTIQAAILKVKLKYLDEWNLRRQELAARYTRLLINTGVVTPHRMPDRSHIFHQYAIRVPEASGKTRSELANYLASQGIPTAIHYPLPIHLQEAFLWLKNKKGDYPVSERVATEILSLPMHADLEEEQVDYIASSVQAFLREKVYAS